MQLRASLSRFSVEKTLRSLFQLRNASILAAVCAMAPGLLQAQSGTVSGKVTDETTGQELPGATVRVLATALGAASSLDGDYRITGVPAGPRTLRVSYVGYESKELAITVTPGRTLDQNVRLSPNVFRGEEVVITAQLEGQARAINRQLASNTIVNVVSADKIQELPDQNAAESLGRLPGISVQRDAGEGQKVVVRGLAPKFNSITVNGERIPSTDGDNRSVDLSMISPDLLAGIEVFKALTPDKDADAVGGTVNLVIRRAPNGVKGNFRLQGGYNNHESTLGPYKGTASMSSRFLQNKLGVLVTGNLERANRASDVIDADYSFTREQRGAEEYAVIRVENLNLADRIETRERFGGSVAADYDLGNGDLLFNSFFSQTDRDELRRRKRYRLSAGRTEYNLRDRDVNTSLWTNALSGRHLFGPTELTWRSSFSRSRQKTPRQMNSVFRELAAFDVSRLEDEKGPEFIPEGAKNRIDATFFKESSYDSVRISDRDLTGQVDFKMPFQLGSSIAGYVKLGAKQRDKNRTRNNTRWWTSHFGINDLGVRIRQNPDLYYRDFALDIQRRVLMENFLDESETIDEFLDDRYEFGPTLDLSQVDTFNEAFFDSLFILDPFTDLEDYKAGEAISAGYFMAEINLGRKLMLLPGFRFEYTETEYTSVFGKPVRGEEGQSTIVGRTDTTGGQSYSEFLPQVHLRYRMTPWADLRLAVTRSVSRPDYFNLVPWERIEYLESTWERGAPDLKHTTAWNYDAFLSFYNRLGLLTVGAFYKEVVNIDYVRQTRVQGGEFNGFQLTEPVNAEGTSTVYGGEVEIQTNLRFLPSPFDGVVLYANYSRMESETLYPFFEIGPRSPLPPYQPTIIDTVRAGRMPGQADYIANFSIGYEKGGFSGRVSMVLQGPSLQFVGTRSELDGFTDAYTRWDLAIQQQVGMGISAYFNVNNFTNRAEKAFLGIENFATQEELFGWTADLGVRYKF